MSAVLRRAWLPQSAVFIALWLGLLAFGRDRMFRDPGTLWHTVVGERILQTQALIHTDPFSFTLADQPWIAQQWLGECAMAIAHRLAGLDTLLLGTATMLAGLYAWVFGRLLRSGLTGPLAALLVLLCIAASSYHFMPRPHLATLILLAVSFALLLDVEAGRRRAWLVLCALPPLMVLWSNVHGGALGGLATIVFILVGWLAWPKQVPGKPKTSPLLIVAAAVLSGLAILVNPYGMELPHVWFGLASSHVLPTLIVEHAPMRWLSVEGAMTAALAGVYLLVLGTAVSARVRISWFVPLIWLALAATRVRHGPLFAVAAVLAIAEMVPHSTLATQLRRYGISLLSDIPRIPCTRIFAGVSCIAVLAASLMQGAGISIPVVGAGWARLNPGYWPIDAADALCARLAADERPRVFNDLRYGGYLLYRVPQARIFIDDRCELYGDFRLQQYVEMHRHPETALPVAREAQYALMRAGTLLEKHLSQSPEWSTVHRDATAVLMSRVTARDETAAEGNAQFEGAAARANVARSLAN